MQSGRCIVDFMISKEPSTYFARAVLSRMASMASFGYDLALSFPHAKEEAQWLKPTVVTT